MNIMIKGLLFLTANRPNIAYSVGVCAKYHADPKESHKKIVNQVLRYMSGTNSHGLFYSKDTIMHRVIVMQIRQEIVMIEKEH